MDPLTELAIRHGTDKFGLHDYMPVYWKLFRDWRDRPLRLLEIGVGGYGAPDAGGESLAMWRDFFANAEITGIDIARKTLDLGPRVAIRQGSQTDAGFLEALSAERGPFDIVIDDGSHRNDHVIATFETLFPLMPKPAIYVVEDAQTAWMPRFGGSGDLRPPNLLAYFADLFCRVDHVEKAAAAGGGADPLAATVAGMERYHNIVAIHRGENTYPSNFRFDGDHPAVKSAVAAIGQVMAERPTANGLLRQARLLAKAGRQDELPSIVERLAAMGAKGSAYYMLATGPDLPLGPDARLDLLREALAAHPGQTELRLRLGEALLEAGRAEEAIELLGEARGKAPGNPRLRRLLGRGLGMAGRPREALAELLPLAEGPLVALPARLLAMLGQTDAALRWLRRQGRRGRRRRAAGPG